MDTWKQQKGWGNSRVWLIYSREHDAWWGPGHVGYTRIMSQAGRYTTEEADAIVKQANIAQPPSDVHEFMMLAPEVADGCAPALLAAHEAIDEAIISEEGLDALEGEQVQEQIEEVLGYDPNAGRPCGACGKPYEECEGH